MSKIISVTNQKGGVGKTTTAVNLSACLATMGYRTLLIDFDPQGNASSGVGIEREDLPVSVYDVLAGRSTVQQAIQPTRVDNLWILPSRTELAAAEVELVGEPRREFALQDALGSSVASYDYVFIDCPPSLSLLTLNALVASDSALVPIQAEYYALEGVARLLDTITMIRQGPNPHLAIEGMVLTMHDGRMNLCRQVESEVREHFADHAFATMIPRNVRLSEAPSFGDPIIMYDIESRGAQSYMELAREFVDRNIAAPTQPH
jgi:chromosome partitioning protein